MAKNQKIVLICSLSLFVFLTLFPPWLYTAYVTGTRDSSGFRSEKDAGYHFIFLPPPPEKIAPIFGVKIDKSRLGLEWLVIAALTGIIYLGNQFNKKTSSQNSDKN